MVTERPFLASEIADDKDVEMIDEENDKYDIFRPSEFNGDKDIKASQPLERKTINFASAITATENPKILRSESFMSVAEENADVKIQGFPFQTTKRRASCCSLFTYWYANTLVDSVELNNGKMHPLFIEDMNTNPLRDEKLLLRF